MERPVFDARWLLAALLAGLVGLTAFVVGQGYLPSSTSREVLSGLAWMSAIVAAICAVRGGVDAGVHRGPRGRMGSR
jgi:hypothetical protein